MCSRRPGGKKALRRSGGPFASERLHGETAQPPHVQGRAMAGQRRRKRGVSALLRAKVPALRRCKDITLYFKVPS